MISVVGVAIAVCQVGLHLTRRRTITHRAVARRLVAAWAIVLLAHFGYQELLDWIAPAEAFGG